MLKAVLNQANRGLVRYNNRNSTQSIWNFLHRWNYEHTWTKNILKLSNKVLISTNKYHIFRWDWMVGLVGCAVGAIVTWLEDTYYQAKIGFKPSVSNTVVSGVFHNQGIKQQLKNILNSNVFTNQDIQYYIHQALLNQVLTPQKQNIKYLIQTSVALLFEPQNHQFMAQALAKNIHHLKQPISSNALTFLNSPQMDSIAANGLSSVLSMLYIKSWMSSSVIDSLKSYLEKEQNVNYLYESIRKKF